MGTPLGVMGVNPTQTMGGGGGGGGHFFFIGALPASKVAQVPKKLMSGLGGGGGGKSDTFFGPIFQT